MTTIKELRDLLDNATPGKWGAIEHENKHAFEGNLVVTPNDDMNDAVCTVWTCDNDAEMQSNASLIAASHNTLPALLDLVEEMAGALVVGLKIRNGIVRFKA